MKVTYDPQVDALYLLLSNKRPDGVIEISEGVNLDVTDEGSIVGIEILDSSKKVDFNTFLTYQLDINKNLLSA